MTKQNKFAYIWKYDVRVEFIDDFLAAYGPDGRWVQFFKRDKNYLETVLMRDESNDEVFLTIDYWTSKTARDDFRKQNQAEFNAIDEHCERFTVSEELMGDFVVFADD